MFNQRLRKLYGRLAILFLLSGLIAYLWLTAERDFELLGSYRPEAALSFMDGLQMQQGSPQDTETASFEGMIYYRMAEAGALSLWLEPGSGYIALQHSRQPELLWASNPGPDVLAEVQTKGLWRSNLASPFTFRYLRGNENKETAGNTVDHSAQIEWKRIEDGVGVRYTVDDLGFAFYFEYTLLADGLQVRVPEHGILETKDNRLSTLDVLPFFAASFNDREGYLFVPDGPGGLIHFAKERPALSSPYDFPVFGADLSIPQLDVPFSRTPIQYPVFGMNRGDSGFLAVIEEGQLKANIYAAPAGLHTEFHAVNASFRFRQPYRQPVGLTSAVTSYEQALMAEPIQIRYTLLDKDDADYVGMAKAYRKYLMSEHALVPLQTDQETLPLYLDIIAAASKPGRFGSETIVTTTLEQARTMADFIRQEGVADLRLGLVGWHEGGYPGKLPKRFPVERKIGGKQGLGELANYARENGVVLYLVDPFNEAAGEQPGTGFSPRSDAARMLDGRALQFQQSRGYDAARSPSPNYAVSPEAAVQLFQESIAHYKATDVSHIGLTGMEYVYSDFSRSGFYERKDTIRVYQDIMDEAREKMDYLILYGAPSFSIGLADHYHRFPVEGNYDFIIDEQVPFYPIALHGLVTYSASPGNERGDPEAEFLRAIEYGALPYFTVTYENTRLLLETSFSSMYSTQFALLNERILQEYNDFAAALQGTWGSFIENHRKLAEGVYETTYGNGRTVWVNYTRMPFESAGHRVEALSFRVVQEGGGR
ncbi:DUF5696 domain-containing protein [Paenibacillus senegalensis]|uniref:DUF5696 domain-containing protein n=1 Tax=Paenibacillus senegalensis TaxID=1465766 RepID=UPI000289CEEC|nr:DUF5696 domain-containing protein [Paenibacillus senegalensis]